MSDDKRALFGRRGDAAQLLAAAKEQIPGQVMSEERQAKAALIQRARATAVDSEAAAIFTEEIISHLNEVWKERDFTPEQRIFSLALATINLRETVPDKFPDGTAGGKDMFDRVCAAARAYYDKHKD